MRLSFMCFRAQWCNKMCLSTSIGTFTRVNTHCACSWTSFMLMLSAMVNSGTYFHIRHKKPCSTHSLVLLHKPNCYPRRGREKKSKVMICAFVGLDFNANLTPFFFFFFFVGQRVLEHAMSTTTKKRVKTGWLLKHRQWQLLVCSITEKKRYWGFLVVVFFLSVVYLSALMCTNEIIMYVHW